MESSRFEQFARVAAIALLVLGCILVLRPFTGAIFFAGVLCFSTWPAYAWLRDRWRGRRTLAAFVVVLGMAIALVVPVALVAQSLVLNGAGMVESVRTFLERRSELAVPEFVGRIPLIGGWVSDYGR